VRGLESPLRLRAAGLVASVLVAAGAYGAGALPGRDPGAGLRGPGTPGAGFWLGLAAWVVGVALLATAWWRLGRRLDGLTTRWLLVTAALWALPLLLAPPLASRDVYSYACQGELWRTGVDPYTTGATGGGCPWAGAVPDLWRDTPTPYGPVAVALSGAAAAVARAIGGPEDRQLLAAVTLLRAVALVGGLLLIGYAGRLARATGVDPARARWLAALSPLVAVNLVSGAHNDALTAGLTVAALAIAAQPARATDAAHFRAAQAHDPPRAHAATQSPRATQALTEAPVPGPAQAHHEPQAPDRTHAHQESQTPDPAQAHHGSRSPGVARALRGVLVAGALLGLAVAVKVTALVALPFVALLAARRIGGRGGRWRGVAVGGALVTGAGAAVFAVASLATGLGLGWIAALSDTGRLVQWTSLPTGVGMAAGYVLRLAGHGGSVDAAVDAARIAGVAALAIIGLALCWRALRATLTARHDAEPHTPKPEPLEPDSLEPGPRRTIVAACGWALAATAVLLPVFYPWYALAPLAVLACATTAGTARRLAVAAIVTTLLVLPNGLGLAVLTKLPGAVLDVLVTAAIITAAVQRRRRSRASPEPATGVR